MYAGKDILTGGDLYLKRTIAAAPNALEIAEDLREELVSQVEAGRHPRTNATVSQLIEEHLKSAELEVRVKQTLQGYARKHIHLQPIGGRALSEGDAQDVQALESFYAELRRCRDHSDGRTTVFHYTSDEHKCTKRCRRHVCKPLAKWTVRKIHFSISAAYESAIRWEWIFTNPAKRAKVTAPPQAEPDPPTAEQAAVLVNECWCRGDLGPFVWLAMTTGARRGELCALRWERLKAIHSERGEHDCLAAGCRWVLDIRRAIAQGNDGQIYEKDIKTHQRRLIALDPETVAVLVEHRQRCADAARAVGVTLTDRHYMFADTPEGTIARKPNSWSDRYERCAERLGINTVLKNLRHYSATELIIGGVDIRTVAGRLGHSGGGTTTLKVYAAWVAAADQLASTVLLNRMPQRPTSGGAGDLASLAPRKVHEQLAADLHADWLGGELAAGTEITVKGLMRSHGVTTHGRIPGDPPSQGAGRSGGSQRPPQRRAALSRSERSDRCRRGHAAKAGYRASRPRIDLGGAARGVGFAGGGARPDSPWHQRPEDKDPRRSGRFRGARKAAASRSAAGGWRSQPGRRLRAGRSHPRPDRAGHDCGGGSMTITAPVAVAHPRRPLGAASHQAGVEVSRDELIRRILRLRTEAYLAGRRIPGRPALAQMTGVSPYRVRQALEEIARDQPRFPEHDQRPANEAHASANGLGAVAAQATQDVTRLSDAPSMPRGRAARLASTGDSHKPGCRADDVAPIGASTAPAPRRANSQRDIAGSLARTAVLISMFALAAAVWIKAAELSGHQIELAVLPIVDWPVRLAYFAPILVEGAVYAAIRICHTLDYVRDGTRNYARRTAIIGLVAMVLVGATVGLGFADEPYIRDGIGGLIGGLGPYMGWRTSRASAMVAGDRRAATTGGAITAEAAPARSNRFTGLLDSVAMAATARVTSWGRTSDPGARTTRNGGANSSADVAPERHERHDSGIHAPAPDAGAQPVSVTPADAAAGLAAANGVTPSASLDRDPRS